MDVREFLPNEEEDIIEANVESRKEKIGQNQVYDIITSRQPDWQAIIYDLIHTEQLDPWDVDLVVLTEKYFEKIFELEEADFYISSKVLLAASLLLRIKSEFLLNKYIKSIDEVLFGRKEEKVNRFERIVIDEDDLPVLIPKTPLPRLKRVTLSELMDALNKAINTESRRIKREVAMKRAKRLTNIVIPEFRKIDLKDRIKQFYARILTVIKKNAVSSEKHHNVVTYLDLVGKERDEVLASFLPLLHLSNNKKLWLEQEGHLEDISIYLYKYFEKNKTNFIEDLDLDAEDAEEIMDAIEGIEVSEAELERLDKLRQGKEDKKKMKEDAAKELAEELGIEINDELLELTSETHIDDVTGFSQENI